MSSAWVPPTRTFHLRLFVLSLAVITICLVGLLFGVRLEDVVPATGTIEACDRHQLRARLAGLVEPGWYEGEVTLADGTTLAVRMDADGNGLTEPTARGGARLVKHQEVVDGEQRRNVRRRRFHPLRAGEILWPGQVVGVVRDEALSLECRRLEDQIKYLEEHGHSSRTLTQERDRLGEYLALGRLRVPETAACWLVLEVAVAPLQKVQAGDVLATCVPADPHTHQPCNLTAVLQVEEKHWGAVAAGQQVRLYSNVFNPRLHGHADAVIESLAPAPESVVGGEPRFHARAPLVRSPQPLPLGSTFQAEIIVGRKLVYRIILEN